MIVGLALLRVAIGLVMDRRSRAVSQRAAHSDPLGEELRAFRRRLHDDVVGAEDFLEATQPGKASRRHRA